MAISSAGQTQMEMKNERGYEIASQPEQSVGDNTDYGTDTIHSHVALS